MGAFAISPAANPLAVITDDGMVHLWDTSAANNYAVLPSPSNGGTGGVQTVTMDATGALLATSNNLNTVQLWDMNSRVQRTTLITPLTNGIVTSTAFSPDGTVLAVAALVPQVGTNGVYLFDTSSGALLTTLPAGGNPQVAFTGNGLLHVLYSGAIDSGTVGSWGTGG